MKNFLRIPLPALVLAVSLGVLLTGWVKSGSGASSRVVLPGNPRFSTERVPLEVAIESVIDQPFATTLYPNLPIFPLEPSLPHSLCRHREFTQTVRLGNVTAHIDFHT